MFLWNIEFILLHSCMLSLWSMKFWEKCGFPKVAHKHFIIFGKGFPFSRHHFNFSDQNINITITSSFSFSSSPNWASVVCSTCLKLNQGSISAWWLGFWFIYLSATNDKPSLSGTYCFCSCIFFKATSIVEIYLDKDHDGLNFYGIW